MRPEILYSSILWNTFLTSLIVHLTAVPETKGNAISENIEDTIQLIKRFQFFQWRTWSSKQETKSS